MLLSSLCYLVSTGWWFINMQTSPLASSFAPIRGRDDALFAQLIKHFAYYIDMHTYYVIF